MNLFKSPSEELLFNVTDGTSDLIQYIKLTNTSETRIAYKVYTYSRTIENDWDFNLELRLLRSK